MKRCGGFTLVEMMVATAVGSLMLGGLMIASTNLQRWFASAEFTIGVQQDEATVLDYLARDIRRCSGAALANGDRKLLLTVPDQTSRADDGSLDAPTLSSGRVRYGTTADTVSYYVQGSGFFREDRAGAVKISTRVDEFHTSLAQPPVVEVQLTFKPAPRRAAGPAVTARITRRNPGTLVQ